MLKKIFTFFSGVAFLCVIGGVVYADARGIFLQDNEAAMQLVDKYMSFVMKNYTPSDEDVSFRGIIKQGCDFWYYNDYNNKAIAVNHAPGSDMEVESASYSIKYNSVDYANRIYTINATITQQVQYKNHIAPMYVVRDHIIMIEQKGREMYIIDDVSNLIDDSTSVMPQNGNDIITETADSPNEK